MLPAVDVGKSVSRVGGKAQWAAFRAVTGDLKLAYAQFEERETFSRFGAQLDADAHAIIEHGKRIRACLGQSESSPVSVAAQIMILLALSDRLFDNVPIERMGEAQQALAGRRGHTSGAACARASRAPRNSATRTVQRSSKSRARRLPPLRLRDPLQAESAEDSRPGASARCRHGSMPLKVRRQTSNGGAASPAPDANADSPENRNLQTIPERRSP